MLEPQTAIKNGLPAMRLTPALAARFASDWHPWLHGWAILTMIVAVIAVVSGSFVTSLQVGMEDRDWPTAPWHLLTTPWSQKSFGYLVEHTHRLADYLTGIFVIGLAIGTWIAEKRCWVRWLGPLALVGVISQGVLGGMRVLKDFTWGTELRIVHGCSAHLFIAFLAVIVLVTSRGWSQASHFEASRRLRVGAMLLVGALYLQVIFGAILRHIEYSNYSRLAQRGHLIFAMVSVAAATWLIVQLRSEGGVARKLLHGLELLLTLQVLLGVETWLTRFPSTPSGIMQQAAANFNSELVLRTLHLLVGSLLFATAVVIAVSVYRSPAVESEHALEGMA